MQFPSATSSVKKQKSKARRLCSFASGSIIFRCYAQSTAEGIPNCFYFAASNSASISAEGAGVTRLTTTQTSREVRKAGSSS